ncbi:hemolysin family protein [Brevibacterium litoralis]|uniref:hemolysin family protein n=1 Tax=Brevibacterium litoralis TaxID=3138935 RepID=UPI0032EBF341
MLSAVLLLLVGVLAMLAIIAANGYFVAQEFAYMSVDRAALRARAEAGDASARRALKVTGRMSFMLSGAQLGITVTGLLIGYVAEPLIGRSLGVLLGGIGVPTAVSITVGTVAALAIATIVQMIFGELYPKNLAIANAAPLARKLAPSTLLYLTVFGWLVAVFDKSAEALLTLLGITPVHDVDPHLSPADLRRAVAESRESGDLPADLSVVIDRVLDFPEQDVEHALVPRHHVDAVDLDTTVDDLRTAMATGHTRYPVVDAEDVPVGVVDLVTLLRDEPAGNRTAADVMLPAHVVPTLMPLPRALAGMVRAGAQLACVVDEHGGFAGILTVEDLAEEIVGELTDEHDETAEPNVHQESADTWTLDASVHVDELSRLIGHDLPEDDYETVAGLTIAHHGALPAVGEHVYVPVPLDPAEIVEDEPEHHTLEVEVLEIDAHVPHLVRVRVLTTVGDEDADRAGTDSRTTDTVAEAPSPDAVTGAGQAPKTSGKEEDR